MAATNNYINFQARLLNSSGTVVPDGNYHIEFKIYNTDGVTGSQGSCSGSCLWMETRSTGNLVKIVNGYFSVSFGSVTAFGAGINWDQQLYLTMRIGGNGGSPSWDGEMQNTGHSIALTGVPYAFRAGTLASFNGTQTGTLSFGTITNSPVLTLPNETGTICSTGSVCTGYAPSTGGSGYVQLQGSTPGAAQTGNFNISGGGTGTGIVNTLQAGTVQAAAATALTITAHGTSAWSTDTGNLTVQASAGASSLTLDAGTSGSGTVNLANTYANTINIAGNNIAHTIGIGNGGSSTIQAVTIGSTSSTSSLLLQGGTGNVQLQSQGGTLGIGNNAIAQTINIGNGTGATAVAVSCGSGTCGFGNNAVDHSSTLGSITGTSVTTLQGGTGGINIGTGNVANTIAIGTATAATSDTVNINNTTNAGSIAMGAGMTTGTIAIGGASTTGTITVGQATTNQTINIGNAQTAAGNTNTIAIGTSSTGTGKSVISIGSPNASGASSLTLESGSGTLAIGNGATAHTIAIGSGAAVQGVTVGSSNSTSTLLLQGGSSATAVQIQSQGTLSIGNNAIAQTINIGNGTGATAVSVSCGSGTCGFGNNAVDHSSTLGSITGTSVTTLQGGTGGINIGTGGIANTVQIGNTTGAVSQNIYIGTNGTGSSSTTVLIGSTIAGTTQIQSASGLILGKTSTTDGTLVFDNHLGTRTVTLQLAANPGTSYTLKLPTTGPALSQCLQNDGTTVGQLTFGVCGSGSGVTTVGLIDDQTKSSDGAVISGNSIYMQTADDTHPGLVSTGTQTFAGDKTFQSTTDSATAFQVQNSLGGTLFRVDTVDGQGGYIINNATSNMDNLLQNPGFEAGNVDGSAQGYWGDVTAVNNPAIAHSGDYYGTIPLGADDYTDQPYAVTPGEQIYFEGWIRTSSGANGSGGFYVRVNDKDGNAVGWENTDWTNPGTTWTKRTVSFIVPAGGAYLETALTIRNDATIGSWYFDDLYLSTSSQRAPYLFQNAVTVQEINSTATFGTELVDNGGSTTCSGSGWSGSSHGPYAHSSGTTPLTCSPPTNSTFIDGDTYQIEFAVTDVTAGTITPDVEGQDGQILDSSSTDETQIIESCGCDSTGINFVPSNDFAGKVTIISVKHLDTGTSAALNITNSDGSHGLQLRSGGSADNSYIGYESGLLNTTGHANTALGYDALRLNTGGAYNTAVGDSALGHNTTGSSNSALGYGTLRSNTTGYYNAAVGESALQYNTVGYGNSALGFDALLYNTSGYNNSSVGEYALYHNIQGSDNSASGYSALQANTSGADNSAFGSRALYSNTTGYENTAIGEYALGANTTGIDNTAIGIRAGFADNWWDDGFATLDNLQNTTMIGAFAQAQASNTLILGGAGDNAVNVGIGTTSPTNLFSISPVVYKGVTASMSGYTITGSSGTYWQSTGAVQPGMEFIFATNGDKYIIQSVNSETSITATTSGSEGSQQYRIHNPAFYVSDNGSVGIRNTDNSATAFQVQNVEGSSLFTVDANNYSVVLGSGVGITNSVAGVSTGGLRVDESTTNIVTNPSFEIDYDGWGSYWSGALSQATGGVVGQKSLQVVTVGGNGNNDGTEWHLPAGLSTGNYTLSFYIKSSSGTPQINCGLEGATEGSGGWGCWQQAISTTWTRVTSYIPITAWSGGNSSNAKIVIKEATDNASAITYFVDGVQLENKSVITGYTEGTRTAGTTVAENNLEVNGATTLRGNTTVSAGNSTTAFKVQDAAGASLLTADTTNSKTVVLGDVNVGTRGGSRLFTDNFESGGLSLWNEILDTLGDPGISVSSSVVHNGKYAAKVNTNGSVNAYARQDFTAQNTVYVRVWAYRPSGSSLAGISLENTNSEDWGVYSTGDSIRMYAPVGGTVYYGPAGSFTSDTWHLIEFRVTIGNPGTLTLWVDGDQLWSTTSIDNHAYQINTLELGAGIPDTMAGYYDDLSVDTVSNGTASSLNVDDSLHVGGTSFFSNTVFIQPAYDLYDALAVTRANGNPLFGVDTVDNAVIVGSSDNSNPTAGLQVDSSIGSSPFNMSSNDTKAAAQGAGGGIGFGGWADLTTSFRTFGAIQGYHESATASDYAGALRFLTRPSGGNLTQVLNLSSTGAATFQNSTNSATAMNVLNSAGSSVLSVDTSKANANNKVANPSFESSTPPTAPTNWSVLVGSTITSVATPVYEGSKAMQVATTTTANSGASYTTGAGFLTTAHTYGLSMYVYDSSIAFGNATTFELGYSQDGSTYTACATGLTLNPNAWNRVTCSFTTGSVSGTPFIYLRKTGSGTNTNYTFVVDEVLLQDTALSSDSNYRNGAVNLTGALINSPMILQANANSSTAFQVQNAAGGTVFNVSTADENLISNPSFEVDTSGWSLKSASTMTRDTSQKKYGNASLKVVTTAASQGVRYTFPTGIVGSASSFMFSFEMFNNGGAAFSAIPVVGYNTGSDTNCAAVTPATVPSLNGWTRYTAACTAITGTIASIYVQTSASDSAARTFNIDAVQFEFGATASAYGLGQISLSGVVNTPLMLRNQQNSDQALLVQNAAGTNFLSVDTLNGNVTIGSSATATNTVTIEGGTAAAAIQIGNGATAHGIQIGANAAGVQTIKIGNAVASSALTLTAGTGNMALNTTSGTITLQSTTAGAINIKPGGTSNVVLGTSDTNGNLLVLDTKTNAADAAGVNGGIYFSTGGQGGAGSNVATYAGKFRCYEGGLWKNCIGMRDIAERRWGYASIGGTVATTFNTDGMYTSAILGAGQSGSVASSNQAESNYVMYTTGIVSGNSAGFGQTSFSAIAMQTRWLPKLVTRIRVDPSAVTTARYWVALGSAALSGSDGTGSYIGVRYSTNAGDAAWQCASDDGTTNSVTTTGVTVTAGHYYDIIVDLTTASTLVCSVSDNGGAYTTVTKATNLPGTSTSLGLQEMVTTLTTAARNLSIAYSYLEYQ
jgi:hypothetical protein